MIKQKIKAIAKIQQYYHRLTLIVKHRFKQYLTLMISVVRYKKKKTII